MTTTEDRLMDDAVDILRRHGALTTEEWSRLVVNAGCGNFDDVFELLETGYLSRPLGPLADGRHVALDVLLEGRVLTHRLTEQEIASDVLGTSDLSPIAWLMPLHSESDDSVDFTIAFRGLDNELFANRGLTKELWPPISAMVLRCGTLDNHVSGDVVALRFTDGHFTLVAASDLGESPVSEPLRSLVPDGSSTEFNSVVWQLMYDDPTLFTHPVAPLADLLGAAGFERSGERVAAIGYDFDAERFAKQADGIAEDLGLAREDGMALLVISDVVEEIQSLDHDSAVTRAAELVRTHSSSFERIAGTRFALAVRVMGDEHSDALDVVCAAIIETLPSPFHVGALWIRSQTALFDRRPLDAEVYLENAVDIDPSWGLVALDLARLCLIRGAWDRGISLLDNADFDDRVEPVAQFMKYLLDDCAHSDASIHDRVARLVFMVHMMSFQVGAGPRIDKLVHLRSSQLGGSDEAFQKSVGDPFVNDVALIEGELLAEFTKMVGAILSPANAVLAGLYGSVERSVFEVTKLSSGSAITLHDRRSGRTAMVVDEVYSDGLRVGDFICSRLVPVDGRFELFGGVEPVDPSRRFDLVRLLEDKPVDPAELIEFLGERFAPRRRKRRQRR